MSVEAVIVKTRSVSTRSFMTVNLLFLLEAAAQAADRLEGYSPTGEQRVD